MRESVKRIVLLSAWAFAALTGACSFIVPAFTAEGEETLFREERLRAYGKTWKWIITLRTDTQYYFFGLIPGGAKREREFLYLEKDDSSRIPLHERVYALQRDGSYKKVEPCCGTFGGIAQPLVDFDDKLIFVLQAGKEPVTDCFVHPPNAPDNERRPREAQIANTTFLGEFDASTERVLLNQFFPGTGGGEDKSSLRTTMRSYYEHMYANRRPFICDR